MAAPTKRYCFGNWKMNKRPGDVPAYFADLRQALGGCCPDNVEVAVFPPFLLLGEAVQAGEVFQVTVGAQTCGTAESGAFTGEVSPALLADFGVRWVLAGHSERRHKFGESDGLVAERAKAALAAGLSVTFCVGETLAERREGRLEAVLARQLEPLRGWTAAQWDRTVIAYEPVWAIGTGETATPAQASEAHRVVARWCRDHVQRQPAILYGGSVTAANAAELAAADAVDGLLVGGASLDGKSFAAIARALAETKGKAK